MGEAGSFVSFYNSYTTPDGSRRTSCPPTKLSTTGGSGGQAGGRQRGELSPQPCPETVSTCVHQALADSRGREVLQGKQPEAAFMQPCRCNDRNIHNTCKIMICNATGESNKVGAWKEQHFSLLVNSGYIFIASVFGEKKRGNKCLSCSPGLPQTQNIIMSITIKKNLYCIPSILLSVFGEYPQTSSFFHHEHGDGHPSIVKVNPSSPMYMHKHSNRIGYCTNMYCI